MLELSNRHKNGGDVVESECVLKTQKRKCNIEIDH